MSTLELTDERVDELLRTAAMASERSHSPHSCFKVGAAVLAVKSNTDEVVFVPGTNVESASYGVTICAERAALVAAISMGYTPIHLAVVVPQLGAGAPLSKRSPCGACRQLMFELLGPDGRAVLSRTEIFSMSELLPEAFAL